jgi:hypothetical protein
VLVGRGALSDHVAIDGRSADLAPIASCREPSRATRWLRRRRVGGAPEAMASWRASGEQLSRGVSSAVFAGGAGIERASFRGVGSEGGARAKSPLTIVVRGRTIKDCRAVEGIARRGPRKAPLFHNPLRPRRRSQADRETFRKVGERGRRDGGESMALSQLGKEPRRGRSALGVEPGSSPTDPGGPGRPRSVSSKVAGKPMGGIAAGSVAARRRAGEPQGGESPGGERAQRRRANSRLVGSDSGDGKPRGRAGGPRDRRCVVQTAAKCAAGGRPTSRRRRASQEVPTDPGGASP